MTAKESIDEYIIKTNDWRGDLIKKIRGLILEVKPGITEEWKWNSPVFSHNGKMICSVGAFKTHVKVNFFDGASLEDTAGLFNNGSEAKKSRSIDFQKEDIFNKNALKKLLMKAIAYTSK